MPEEMTVTVTEPATTETVEATIEAKKAEEAAKAVDAAKTPEQLKQELEGAQARIHELNKENEKRRKAQEALEAAQKEAAEAQLAEQGKFKELADTRTAERDAKAAELTAAQEKLTRYDTLLAADIDKRIAAWPDEVKKLIPSGDGVDALARMERIAELGPLAERLMKAPAPAGNGAGPVASGMPVEALKEAQQAQASATRRAF